MAGLRHWLERQVSDGLSLAERLEIQKFRQEISRWEHASNN